ncbi:MAG TPA: hypothetical protein PKJ00_03750 [Verrucomicrobiota bacterium]|nr:hypothetical protein [Verrucomicrobiota bacterium]HNS69366.1 hypothetical protein [Verrucomicrobiota bacterium]
MGPCGGGRRCGRGQGSQGRGRSGGRGFGRRRWRSGPQGQNFRAANAPTEKQSG